METTALADIIPADFFVYSEVDTHDLGWGRGTEVYGDGCVNTDLEAIVTEDMWAMYGWEIMGINRSRAYSETVEETLDTIEAARR